MIRRICMKLSIATDFLVRHVVRSVILVIVMTFCLTTMISGIYLNVSTNRYRSRINALVDVPIKNLSIVTIRQTFSEISFGTTYKILSNKEGFLAAGEVIDSAGCEITDWIGLSEALYGRDSSSVKQVQCNFDTFQFCKPELSDGKYYDVKEAERLFGKYKTGIYIGADYRGAIPTGTIFKYKWHDRYEIVVLGHFKKGEKLISDLIIDQENIEQNKTDIELDDKIVLVHAAEPDTNHFFLASKNSASEFRASVRDELDSGVNIVTMEEVLQDRDRKNENMHMLFKRLFVLIISTATCMIFSFQIVAINESNKTYGILLTNGYKKKDIAVIVVIENILKYLLSFSLALFFAYFKHYMRYKENRVGGDIKAFNNDFIVYTIPLCFLIGLGVVILAIAVPLLRLCKRPVGEYLRDK